MDESIGSILADVSRLMRRSFDARARDIGVTRPQWQVLIALARHEGVKQSLLAEILDVEPITICRMIDRLQEASLVERRPDPADRRAWCLFLTDKARGVIDQLRPLATEMFEVALEGVSTVERSNMINTLDRIRQNLSRTSADPMVAHG
jgi:DNA-binding MarR family transcriptional regulator